MHGTAQLLVHFEKVWIVGMKMFYGKKACNPPSFFRVCFAL